MKELNEKLAEVCGVTMDGSTINGNLCKVLRDECGGICYIIWNPAGDEPNLTQLRECYLALSDDQKESFAFHNRYAPTDWVFTNPELVAQAILKAKGVE